MQKTDEPDSNLNQSEEHVDGLINESILEGDSTQIKESSETNAPQVEVSAENLVIKLQDELSESRDKYMRLYAEFENFRRRTMKEKLDMLQSANEKLIVSFLTVLDDFERAMKSVNDKKSKEFEGFQLINNKFEKIFEQYGVKPMDCLEVVFDADFHEAISQVAVEDEKQKGKILEVVEKGYMLNDKVIRFAKVVVGS